MGSVRLHGEGRTVTVRIATDAGAERCCIRDDVIVVDQSRNDPGIVADIIGPALLGEDPCYHARIWQRLAQLQRLQLKRLHDRIIAVFDVALWDLLGNLNAQQGHRFIGTFRDILPLDEDFLAAHKNVLSTATPRP